MIRYVHCLEYRRSIFIAWKDNNSDDDIEQVLDTMDPSAYNVTRHLWPWMKYQEAGFAHCALRASESCEWVGFIDIDEFLHFPGNQTLQVVIQNYSSKPRIGELRTACHSFGPSGRTKIPKKGVTTGYTCRLASPECHKSIVRLDALNPLLINVELLFIACKVSRSIFCSSKGSSVTALSQGELIKLSPSN
jgi:hypothetical protein